MYLIAWMRPVMPFIEYKINKERIAKVLCVNKDKVEMQCNGKCHLKKQLRKANNESSEQPLPTPTSSKTLELTTLLFERTLQCLNPIQISKTIVFYIENYQTIYINSIFHPPKC